MRLFESRRRWLCYRGFGGRVITATFAITVTSGLTSCGVLPTGSKVEVQLAGGQVTSISKITPIAARPNEVVSLTGKNFSSTRNLKVSVDLESGERATAPLTVTNSQSASFTMPEGAGLGLKVVTLTQGATETAVTKFNLIADQADNQLPILIDAPSEICSTKQYIDRNGETKTGTKDCTAAIPTPACTEDGGSNCVVDGSSYVATKKENLTAGNIKSGVTIAGVPGALIPSPAACSSNGQQSCVATGSYFAGTNCAADGSNCFLPAYSVPGFQTKKAIDFATIDSSKMLDTLTVSGVTGTVASRGAWDVRTAFPGAGFYSAITNTPATGTYTGTLFGTGGTAVLKPADCSANNVTGCVTTSTFKSADLTNLSAGNIKSTVTIAGVTGNYPSATSPLDGADTTADLSNVQATRESQLRSATNFEFFMSDGTRVLASGDSDISSANIANGFNIFGQAGGATLSPGNCSSNGQQSCVAAGSYFAGTNCAANGSGCYLPTYVVTTQPLRAINYDTINSNAGSIRTSATLGGVTGTLADCSTNGSSGCVATSTYLAGQNRSSWDMTTSFPGAGYYSGTTNAPTAGNIKSGVSIAGVTGQYPNSSFPLTGSSGTDLTTATFNAQIKSSATFQYFGSDGVRYTGTGDADIVDSNIKSAVNIFGATGNVTAAVAPDPWNVRVGTTINGVAGKLKVNCRNRVNSSIYNYDGAIGSIGNITRTGGSVRDIWDTIDDRNNSLTGVPSGTVASWSSSTDCYGVESVAGDDNVWKDVTTTSGGAASNCAADSARCTMQDKITGLWWSNLQVSASWDVAWSNCQSLNHNGQSGWRLPTQKELMEASTHGIRSAARTNWITEASLDNNFWSGTSTVYGNSAWVVFLSGGSTYDGDKSSSQAFVCVR